MDQPIDEKFLADDDTITVPDELMETMKAGADAEAKPEEPEKPEERSQQEPDKEGERPERQHDKEAVSKEGEADASDKGKAETADEDAPLKKEQWRPKHNPEYYKKKGEKTRKHIKELTDTRNAERERREAAEAQAEEYKARIQELERRKEPGVKEDDPRVQQLDDIIAIAEEDDNDIALKALKKERAALLGRGKEPDPTSKAQRHPEPQEQAHQPQTQPSPSASKWMERNKWYGAADGYGRPMYPQLMRDALEEEAALRAKMPMDDDLYEKLDKKMEIALEAYGLAPEEEEDDGGTAPPEKAEPKDTPKTTLQPSRTGGAEETNGTRKGGMSDADKARMKAIFKKTGMDSDNPDHRRYYLDMLKQPPE